MMEVIKARTRKWASKPAGGVKDAAVAGQYLAMAEESWAGLGIRPHLPLRRLQPAGQPAGDPGAWRQACQYQRLLKAVAGGGAHRPFRILVRSVFVRDARRKQKDVFASRNYSQEAQR